MGTGRYGRTVVEISRTQAVVPSGIPEPFAQGLTSKRPATRSSGLLALMPMAIVAGVFLVIVFAVNEALENLRKQEQARVRMEEAAKQLQTRDGEPRHKAEYVDAARDYYAHARKDGVPTFLGISAQ